MERVLFNKVAWLKAHTDWEILIVTTDQKLRPPFYQLPKGVRAIDLGINYTDDNRRGTIGKICGYLLKRHKHKKALSALLMRERPDIVVSLYPSESSFVPTIRDGSKKVLELHFNKFFRLQYNRKGLLGIIDRLRTWQDERIVRRFDRFVVLTNEDRGYWGALKNIEVIPNAAMRLSERFSDVSQKRVIAVGRLDYQKGFDRLIRAWTLVKQTNQFGDWQLDIFGQGDWQDKLQRMIDDRNLGESVRINRPTAHIGEEYARSAMLVMTSHYEGLPMVMIEAMSCGLPVISFDYKCGPKDIIRHAENGMVVSDGDIVGLATAMMRVMRDDAFRHALSVNARNVSELYDEESIMHRWVSLFSSLIKS